MRMKKTTIAKVIPSADSMAARYPSVSEIAHDRKLKRLEERAKFVSVSDTVAESNILFRNWKWPSAYEHYPNAPDLRMVDKYYPHAKGGPLLVDEPGTEKEAQWCFEKQKILKSLGLRHIVIEQNTSVCDALEQLGEL